MISLFLSREDLFLSNSILCSYRTSFQSEQIRALGSAWARPGQLWASNTNTPPASHIRLDLSIRSRNNATSSAIVCTHRVIVVARLCSTIHSRRHSWEETSSPWSLARWKKSWHPRHIRRSKIHSRCSSGKIRISSSRTKLTSAKNRQYTLSTIPVKKGKI